MITLNTFIPLHTFIYTDTQALHCYSNTMDTHNDKNNTDSVKVNVFNEDGSVKETFWFPVSPKAIIIEDSSDTETEQEKEDKPRGEIKLEEVVVGEKKEQEQEKADQKEEVGEMTEEEEEEETTQDKKKQRRVFHVDEPTPQRMTRLDLQPSNIPALQPVPSVPEESSSIEALEESLLVELPELTDADVEFMLADTM